MAEPQILTIMALLSKFANKLDRNGYKTKLYGDRLCVYLSNSTYLEYVVIVNRQRWVIRLQYTFPDFLLKIRDYRFVYSDIAIATMYRSLRKIEKRYNNKKLISDIEYNELGTA